MQKSNVIVSNGNLIYLPIYSKRKTRKSHFISECMTFVINYTIRTFPFFIQLSPISSQKNDMDFLSNKDYTLKQLYLFKNYIFKDYQKKLIDALIEFFEQYNHDSKGGAIHFKINYFDQVWESMINNYLSECFKEINLEDRTLKFDNLLDKNLKKKFIKPKPFKIDDSENGFKIQPDHYYIDDNYYICIDE